MIRTRLQWLLEMRDELERDGEAALLNWVELPPEVDVAQHLELRLRALTAQIDTLCWVLRKDPADSVSSSYQKVS